SITIRVAATATAPAGAETTITVTETVEEPNVTIDYATELLNNAAVTQEYYVGTGTPSASATWTAVKAGQSVKSLIPTSGTTYLWVRTKATAAAPASPPVQLTLPARPATPTAAQFTYDVAGEKYTSSVYIAEQLEAVIGTFTTKIDDADILDSAAPGTSHQVRVKATGTAFASAALTLKPAARAAAPTAPAWSGTQLTGVTAAMEWTLDTESVATAGDGSALVAATLSIESDEDKTVTVYVRIKATGTKVASAWQTIIIADYKVSE
ncbi:MAG: hypothetical protein LBT12_05575, partial [Oscillospiraceae bacterium]|nr:hypothetical protein [Oscillospiraceae bacterium]